MPRKSDLTSHTGGHRIITRKLFKGCAPALAAAAAGALEAADTLTTMPITLLCGRIGQTVQHQINEHITMTMARV